MGKKKPTKQKKSINDLTSLEFEVTQEDGTEPAFENEYWDNKRPGIYVDIITGEPLFSSVDKYDSGTGWPSFTKALEPENILTLPDYKLEAERIEVRAKKSNSHLGHVFDDGPAPDGKRYCMNSAALRFIPAENLEAEGYARYAKLFKEAKSSKPRFKGLAYFGGGCFWCMEEAFSKVKGVLEVTSGYMGGGSPNPSYTDVSSGLSGHVEAIRVLFDPQVISYDDLLKVFWLNVDPTVVDRQFCDVGSQYQSTIFFCGDEQKQAVIKSKAWLRKNFPKIEPVTNVAKTLEFFKAEEKHQNYAENNPVRYNLYNFYSGRERRLKELYGDKRMELLSPYLK
jgi:peptide methionine sulfoxide reductase msrA/msrB